MRPMRISLRSQAMRRFTQLGGAGILLIGAHLSCSPILSQPESEPTTKESKKKQFPLTFATAKSNVNIFKKNEVLNTISVNIGDFNGYVGSRGVEADTINNTFDQLLRDAGQATEVYQVLHRRIDSLENTNKIVNLLAASHKDSQGPKSELWKFGAGLVANPATGYEDLGIPFIKRVFHRGLLTESPVGNVFVDVWNPEYAPYGNPKNMGMLYVIPPSCEEEEIEHVTKDDFLSMVTEVSKNMMTCLTMYNEKYPEEKIELARIRLAPADIYHHPEATKQEVADYFFRGLMNGMKDNSILLRFEYDDGVFRTAFENWMMLYA